ncbi:MarR family transcriptional regulator [Agreia sp. PsM10]|uniref:MarR family winged helix-turn-helix transcriptional regulator n=1 Tax=Agreia sp. PsM10 TaxID=3030533 RepID=UPI00263BACD6|nr:MarR family transcriptional regulator [Agreia sp. PsM10]MDN4641507.1 MarR family transcriptional regulator [Agreia sp. PsM10]
MTDPTISEQELMLGIEAGIVQLFRSGRSALRDYAKGFHPDLQPTGFNILRMIFTCAPAQASTIIQQMGLDKSAVSRQIKVLRDLGLVDTQPDPHDGRSSFLVPTPLAEERMEILRQRVKNDYRDRLGEWTSDDLATFSALLARFNASDPRA